jgi:adenine C2-methylase RlmN of 23S rRNA A2503 and tRNA A37
LAYESYILLDGVNDNHDDVSEFVKLANTIGANVSLSCNQRSVSERLSKRATEAAGLFIVNCRGYGITPTITPENFNAKDLKNIEKEMLQ